MLVRFLCPACHQLLGIAPRKIGTQVTCPKCSATLLVPDPGEAPPADSPPLMAAEPLAPVPQPPEMSVEELPPITAVTDLGLPESPVIEQPVEPAADDLQLALDAPPDAVDIDVLGDLTAYERSPPVHTAAHSERTHTSPDSPVAASGQIVISRRVIYFQAILLAVVGLLALAAGYLIGSGAHLHGK